MIRQLAVSDVAETIDTVLATHPDDELEPVEEAAYPGDHSVGVRIQRSRFGRGDPYDVHGQLLGELTIPHDQLPREKLVSENVLDGNKRGSEAVVAEHAVDEKATATRLDQLGPEYEAVAGDLQSLLLSVPVTEEAAIEPLTCLCSSRQTMTFSTLVELKSCFDPSEPVPMELRRPEVRRMR